MKELNVESYSFEDFMSTEREHLQWQSEGLSYDKLSLQNAIIILKVIFHLKLKQDLNFLLSD